MTSFSRIVRKDKIKDACKITYTYLNFLNSHIQSCLLFSKLSLFITILLKVFWGPNWFIDNVHNVCPWIISHVFSMIQHFSNCKQASLEPLVFEQPMATMLSKTKQNKFDLC